MSAPYRHAEYQESELDCLRRIVDETQRAAKRMRIAHDALVASCERTDRALSLMFNVVLACAAAFTICRLVVALP